MKDYSLYDVTNTLVARLRTDAVSNTPSNFDISQIKNGTGVIVDNIVVNGNIFRRLPTSYQTLKAFCVTNDLSLLVRDSNGDNSAILVGWQVPAGTQYPIVSATGSTKTFLIATDVTASFAPGNTLKVYNADNSLFGTFTEASDSYGAPNTSVVVNETLTDIATLSGKYIINLG